MVIEDEPRMDTNTDGAPMMGRRQGIKPTRERGPALQFSMPKTLQFSMPIDSAASQGN